MNKLKAVTVMFLWASCFPLITIGLTFAPHLTFAALRALIAGAALVGWGIALGRPRPSGTSTWLLLIVAGIGATSLGFLGMFHAAEFIGPGTATVIANTQPLLAAALAYVVLKERIGIGGAVGLALGFVGIAVIAAPGFTGQLNPDQYLLGVAYVLLAALGISVSNVALKRLAGDVDALMAVGSQLLIGAIPLMVMSAMTESPISIIWSAKFILSLLGLALPGTALAYWMWFSILETMTLNRANAYSFLVPFFGISLGIAFYGEALTLLVGAGASITVVGILLVNHFVGSAHRSHVRHHLVDTDEHRVICLGEREGAVPSHQRDAVKRTVVVAVQSDHVVGLGHRSIPVDQDRPVDTPRFGGGPD